MQILPAAEWGGCNLCRIYMQMTWLSELTSGDGIHILGTAFKGICNPVMSRQWKWPNQGQPTAQDWAIWRKFLASLGTSSRAGCIKLYKPLGNWEAGNEHAWYYDPDSDRLLHALTNTVFVRKTGRPTRQAISRFISSSIPALDFPKTVVGTTETHNGTITLTGSAPVKNILSSFATFCQFLKSKQEWEWLTKNLHYDEGHLAKIAREISQGHGIAVSDGSFDNQRGTALLVIEGCTSDERILADVMVPGEPDIQCAFRSEAAGILAAIQLVHALLQFYNIQQGSITMYCDGKSALQRCFSDRVNINSPHWDIITTAISERNKNSYRWIPTHVHGHQTAAILTREAVLNNEMDQRCKQYWHLTESHMPVWFHVDWQLGIGGKRVSSNLAQTIRQHCAIQRAERYWKTKWTMDMSTIDWNALEGAQLSCKKARRQWMTKHSSGFCSVGYFAKKIGLRDSDKQTNKPHRLIKIL
jgi:hypothetical protein